MAHAVPGRRHYGCETRGQVGQKPVQVVRVVRRQVELVMHSAGPGRPAVWRVQAVRPSDSVCTQQDTKAIQTSTGQGFAGLGQGCPNLGTKIQLI